MMNLLATAAALAASLNPAQPPSQPLRPALYVVRSAGTTIYVFGTLHALDPKSQWLDDTIRSAFEQSDELVLETLVPERPSQPLSPPVSFQPPSATSSASFLATARMAISAGQSRGMQVGDGADMVLRRLAEAEGKEVAGLETLQLQVNMFNQLPATPTPRPRPAAATSAADQMADLSNAMAEMQVAWNRGDQQVFVKMLDQLKAASPVTYRVMFTERNTRWADWIRARMQTHGTVFVAVGAGHLAGKDSLLVKLAERGLPSQRVY